MARLRILSKNDLDKLYKIPNLKDDDRELIFELDKIDTEYLNKVKDIHLKINYILQLCYFRISNYFFSFSVSKVREDVKFIAGKFFPEEKFRIKEISSRQVYLNRKMILKKYGMVECSKSFKTKIEHHLEFLVKKHMAPKYLIDSVLDFCSKNKVVRPSYTTLQDLISNAIKREKIRLNNKLYKLIDNSLRPKLSGLITGNDIFYKLSIIKKDQKDFTTTEIRNSVEKHQMVLDIYKASVDIISELGISEINVSYYAELVLRYTPYDLRNMKMPNLARLYMLCYVNQRFLKINDHLISSFIYKVKGYISDADIYQKDAIYQEQMLDKENRELTGKILSINIDSEIDDSEIRNEVFAIVPEKEFASFIKKVRNPNLKPDYYRWKYYREHSMGIKQNLRSAFRTLEFQTKSAGLKDAIGFIKRHFDSKKSFSEYRFEEIPTDFIPSSLRRYVIESTSIKDESTGKKQKSKSVNPNTYEFMIYQMIEKGLYNGAVTVSDSMCYRALNDELIPYNVWSEKKSQILEEISSQLPEIDFVAILSDLEKRLTKRYSEINKRIASGDNNKIKIKFDKNGSIVKWHLPYKKADDSVNNPFYDVMKLASLNQIIRFTDDKTDFIQQFSHILPSYSKNKPEESSISACLVAKATGIDIGRMKDISDILEKDLKFSYNNFIRYKTLTSASDAVINQVAKLPIFEKYNLADYGVHASVDGQKIETKFHTIKARYSSKYFGLGKGVVSYTLFANCLPLSTKIIGANEHESHYLFDAIKSNSSDVEISAVSGDMHSLNKVNFALLHMFGYRFMPRFTRLDEKAASNLVSFDNVEKHKKSLIKPSKQVNKALILKEADNILRILATLALKENTQSNIIRKLSSYRSNDTLKALIELDKIIMSLYILDYIDDEGMRKTVHRSLNRGESYHQLKSAILRVAGRKLPGRTELDLAINNECARLIALCIIFYNAYLLSRIYEHCISNNLHDRAMQVIRLSPVAWQHISLVGKYEFKTNTSLPSPESMIEGLLSTLDDTMVITTKPSQKRWKG